MQTANCDVPVVIETCDEVLVVIYIHLNAIQGISRAVDVPRQDHVTTRRTSGPLRLIGCVKRTNCDLAITVALASQRDYSDAIDLTRSHFSPFASISHT
jgi:hypothetical protein